MRSCAAGGNKRIKVGFNARRFRFRLIIKHRSYPKIKYGRARVTHARRVNLPVDRTVTRPRSGRPEPCRYGGTHLPYSVRPSLSRSLRRVRFFGRVFSIISVPLRLHQTLCNYTPARRVQPT